MKPINFKQANVIFAKDQPEYNPLPAYKIPEDPEGTIITKWELTPEELNEINETGCLYLKVLTFNYPPQPVLLTTQNPF